MSTAAPLFAAPACELAGLVGHELVIAAGDVAQALECDRGHEPMAVTGVAAGLSDPDGSVALAVITPDGYEIEITVRLRRL